VALLWLDYRHKSPGTPRLAMALETSEEQVARGIWEEIRWNSSSDAERRATGSFRPR